MKPQQTKGKFYTPEEVSLKLLFIARRYNFSRIRVSGAEPILGEKSFEHFCKLVKKIYEEESLTEFILETNGLLLGLNEKFCKKLAEYPLVVRVSIKGWDEESFEKISGADRKFFVYPLKAIKSLQDFGVEAWPAVMYEVFREGRIKILGKRLKEMGIESEIEMEYLEAYPFVLKNLEARKIKI